MSDTTDDMEVGARILEYEIEREEERIKSEVWTCKDGREIAVKDMKISHVENALAMLKRNGYIGENELALGMMCSQPRGDMAQYYYDQELDRMFTAPVSSFIDVFKEELERRYNE